MPRFKLTIEYDGTRYSGWQKQPGTRTIQGECESAIRQALQLTKFDFQGSGRTDAGVHATGQVAHLAAGSAPAPEILRLRLNDALPADITVIAVERASESFHARHDAIGKTYLYQISRRRTAFGKRYVWWLKDHLDVLRMREAAEEFLGMNDLRAFTDDDPEEKSTKVLVEDLRVSESGDLIIVRIDGSHFLWKSVRRVTAILVEVGRGTLSRADVISLLRSSRRDAARFTAPPSGLFLARVYYRGMTRPKTIHPLLNLPHER